MAIGAAMAAAMAAAASGAAESVRGGAESALWAIEGSRERVSELVQAVGAAPGRIDVVNYGSSPVGIARVMVGYGDAGGYNATAYGPGGERALPPGGPMPPGELVRIAAGEGGRVQVVTAAGELVEPPAGP